MIFFEGKKVLDAGCGDTVKTIIKFCEFGSRDLTGIDIGSDWINNAKENLKKYSVIENCVKLIPASIDNLPFNNNEFDFVCCHGVLLHLASLGQVDVAFRELSRITKSNGYLYTVYGCYGGLFEDAIFPAIREYYSKNENFKKLIDNLAPENFQEIADIMAKGMLEHGNEKNDISLISNYFDIDLCTFIQNFTQAPTRLPLSPEHILKLHNDNGFEPPVRLKRFVKRENLRKYFAPLHYYHDNPYSQILYGTGNLEYLAKKL